MEERQYAVPMREEDMRWVREYLSHDAATNHPRLQEATHWWVWEWTDPNGIAHVEVIEGDEHDKFSESGFSVGDGCDSYYEVIGYLIAQGFPKEDF